ncbi:MAG: hypothetical protein UH850_11090 [Paludibacteraceae bacterium]|nr:hypothetical protein [Paludibacteraceae bacterium]
MAKAMGKSATKKSMATASDPVPEYVCPHCGKLKKRSEFYVSSDPAVSIGIAFPCKDCAENIARRYDLKTDSYSDVTETSLKNALMYLDKPFLKTLWDSAYNEVHDASLKQPKRNIWAAYIKSVQMVNYKTMRWRDGDFDDEPSNAKNTDLVNDDYIAPDVAEELERNRRDVVRLVGYDPFEKEQLEDKPLLYAQTVGYLDMSGNNDDAMRTSSVITIVRGFLQIQKLDDMIAQSMMNAVKSGASGEIKAFLDAKQKISSTISQLAEQNCISLKHNKNNTKGENTWTGKVRIMKEMNLREAEVNIFDAETAIGLAQVADISNASILKQINLDENDYVQMLTEQKKMIEDLNKKANEAIEKARILLRENIDLKKLLEENDIDISEQLSKDTILYEE